MAYHGSNNDLPGPKNKEEDPTLDFRRSQHFEVVKGLSQNVPRMIPGKVGIGRRPLANERPDTWMFGEKQLTGTQSSSGCLPKWLLNDKKILRFWSYFIVPVSQGGLGTSHKRRFNLYYFLEDDTIKVTEILSNHGRTSHQTFIRRHRIPFKNSSALRYHPKDECINFWDLNLGNEIDLYGRIHVLTDCDAFTKSYISKSGVRLNPSVAEMPDNMC